MKKSLLLLVIVPVLAFTGCTKKTASCSPTTITTKAPDTEVSALKGILSGSGITATQDDRGFFYNFSVTGTGAKPNTCSVVVVDYELYLMNGTKIEANTNIAYPVTGFILGWQEMLPLMPVGSTVTVYVPPSLAYGSTASTSIPANSNLKFVITLKSFQ